MIPGGRSALSAEDTGAVSADRFEILQKLGAGGMGVVYRAYDHQRQIQVALKTLPRADARALYRFKREFRTLADVAHPNLVSLYELHTVNGQWFFTMELVDGLSFLSYVRPLPASQDASTPSPVLASASDSADVPWMPRQSRRERIAAGVPEYARLERSLLQLADGLEALHAAGTLHRDIKPSNVLVEPDGRVVLLDFGLAADLGRAVDDRTHERKAVGTPMYMSPEQAADVPLTTESDWYSVGVMLFEALTGQRPFEGARFVSLEKQSAVPPRPQELAVGVPAHLDDLCARLLSRDPRERPDATGVRAALGGGSSSAVAQLARGRRRSVFVGRRAELDELRGALHDSRAGATEVVFLRGESGMGKSALMRRFLGIVSTTTRAVVLEGRCHERELLPFKAIDAIVDAVTRELLSVSVHELHALLPRDIVLLARLFPVLARVGAIAEPERPVLLPPDPQELRRRAFAALQTLLERLAARHGMVVYIDDLQWGDVDSARVLTDLIGSAARILLVLAYRVEDEPSSELIARLRAHAGARTRDLTLGPLSDDESRALMRELGRDPGLHRSAMVDAGGSPLFLRELAAADGDVAAAGMRSLEALIGGRIARLAPELRSLLLACAALGRPCAPDVVLEVAGIAGEGPQLGALQAERLLRTRLGTEPGTYRVEVFHDRIRAAALNVMGTAELRDLHRRAATVLEARADAEPRTLVAHWSGAGDLARAGRHAITAARAAASLLAFHTAAQYYALALEHLDLSRAEQCELHAEMGDALANAGRLEAAAEAYGAAADRATGGRRVELRALEVEQVLRHGHLEDGMTRARALLASVGVRVPGSNRAALASLLSQRALLRLRGLDFVPRPPADVSAGDHQRLEVLWSIASAMTFVNPIAARALQMKYMRLALAAGQPSQVALALNLEIGYVSAGGARTRRRVEPLIARAAEIAAALDDPRLDGVLGVGRGVSSFLRGAWRDAYAELTAAEAQLRDHATGARWELDSAQIFQTATLVHLGELGELAQLVPRYLREADERGDVYAARGLRAWRSNMVWLVADRPDEARAQAERVRLTGEFHSHHFSQLRSLVLAALYEGDGDEAWQRLRAVEQDVKRSMLLRVETFAIDWHWLQARAVLARTTGASRARIAEARALAKVLRGQSAPWAHALSALVLGNASLVGGDEGGAVRHWRAALTGFEASSMAAHAAFTRARLARIVGGEEGAALAAAHDVYVVAQGIANPVALARAMVGTTGDGA